MGILTTLSDPPFATMEEFLRIKITGPFNGKFTPSDTENSSSKSFDIMPFTIPSHLFLTLDEITSTGIKYALHFSTICRGFAFLVAVG
jgi:hypothetical protein